MSVGPKKAPVIAQRTYECRLDFGASYIHLDFRGNVNIHSNNQALTSNELSVVALINDLLRSLRSGKPLIEYSYDPYELVTDKTVLCQWNESGYLKVHEEEPKRLYMHANTVDEAMVRKGTFTTLKSISSMLPRRRSPELLQAFRDRLREKKVDNGNQGSPKV